MPLPWPSFWQHVRPDDRAALSDVLTELLSAGSLFGDGGRDRELFLLAREYHREIGEYFAPLHLEVVPDPDRPILQLRPVPGDCGLTARFSKAETLVVLTLWRIWDDALMERTATAVVVSANELWSRLKLYFETIELPGETQLREILGKLRSRRLIRFQRHEETQRFGDSLIEILPTLARAIPFQDAAAWEQQAALYRGPAELGADADAAISPTLPLAT
jgi:CRP-like cAMP-binding protein